MITVTYHPIESVCETSQHKNLAEWFVCKFGENINIPFEIAVTLDDVDREHEITESIKAGDPEGYLSRGYGVFHVLEIPLGGKVGDFIEKAVGIVFPVASLGTFLVGAAVKAAIPKPQIPSLPSLQNRRQESPTNSLGNRENTARPGERYQDVRGFEPAVYADLLMEPHRRYEDNKEVEYIYGSVSTGKVDVTDPREGVTPFENIDGAQLNVYWPGTSPNTGDDPILEIGGKIEYPVVASYRNRNVNGQELIPPNVADYKVVGPFRLIEGSTKGWVNLLAQAGIYKAGENDETYSATFSFTLYEIASNGERTGNSVILPSITMSSNPTQINGQVGKTVDFDIPYVRCEIEGKRTSNTDTGFEGTVIDEVKWAALYTVEPSGDIAPEGVTTSYAKIIQTEAAVAAQERKLNFGVTRYERRYLGNGQMSAEPDTPSDEFADAVVGLALDPYVGKNITIDQLDVDSLYAVQDEIANYFGTREAVKFGYSFSTTGITFEDHLVLIGNAVFCRVFRIGNSYTFRFDRPKSKGERALILNHRMKYAGTDKRSRKFTDVEGKQYDGVVVTYKDIKTKVFENIRIPEGAFPTNPLEIESSGVVYPQVAKWRALREWNKLRYRRVFHETEAHSSSRGLLPGDRIGMANDTLTRSKNGQVLEQSGLDLRLVEGANVEEGVDYDIALLYKSGYVENIKCTSSPIGPYWVRLMSLPSEPLYTGNLQQRTVYNLYESVDAEKDDMMVETVTVDIKNGQERVRVQAVNYDVRYWEGDPKEVSTGSFSTAFSDAFDKG